MTTISSPEPKQPDATDFKQQYQEVALPLFRQGRYDQALEVFRRLYALASASKDQAAILTNIAKCLEHQLPTSASEILELMEPYASSLATPDAHNFATYPALETFEILVRACHHHIPETSHSLLSAYAQKLPERFRPFFLASIVSAFDKEAIRFDSPGYAQRVIAMGQLYLSLTNDSSEYTGTRVALRNRMADTLLFSTNTHADTLDNIGLLPTESQARQWLLQSLKEQPEHAFARELKKHLEQRGHFRMQLARFWHDIRNRIAPLKVDIRRLRTAHTSHDWIQDTIVAIERNITWIDTALRVSGASHGVQDVFQPDPTSFAMIDPQELCRDVLEEEQLSSARIITQQPPRTWEIAPQYLRLTLANLLTNTREAYERRSLPIPDPAVEITILYNQGRILLRDWAGGISDSLEDPFAPYASTKDGIHIGAGLGLVQARAAIQQQGGSLFLHQAQPTDGCLFVIQFHTF